MNKLFNFQCTICSCNYSTFYLLCLKKGKNGQKKGKNGHFFTKRQFIGLIFEPVTNYVNFFTLKY